MLNSTMKRAAWTMLGGLVLLTLGLGARAGDGDFAPGDDLIGSLPILYPQEGSGSLTSGPQATGGELGVTMDVTLTLTGSMDEVEGAILDAYGQGWVEVEKTSIPDVFTYVFHGNVIIDMQRNVLERGLIKSTLRPGLEFLGGVAGTSWNGKKAGGFVIKNYEFNLALQGVLNQGVVDVGGIALNMLSRTHVQSFLGIQAFGDQVQLELVTY
jgi:hypothetical protein